MKVRKRNKDKMRYAPKVRGRAPYRKDATHYEDFCCKTCYWDWGVGFDRKHLYKHECTESNYLGLLKKYWKTSIVDYFADEDTK